MHVLTDDFTGSISICTYCIKNVLVEPSSIIHTVPWQDIFLCLSLKAFTLPTNQPDSPERPHRSGYEWSRSGPLNSF